MRRSYSSVLRENNSLKEKNKRLRKDCDEKEKSVQKYKGRLGQAKKILEKRSGQAKKAPKIPCPGGAFGRSWVDGDGNTRQSLSLKDEMQIDQTEYLKLRTFVRKQLPFDQYRTFKQLPSANLGAICVKAAEKFKFLHKFDGFWPVEVIARTSYENFNSYARKKTRNAAGDDEEEEMDEANEGEREEAADMELTDNAEEHNEDDQDEQEHASAHMSPANGNTFSDTETEEAYRETLKGTAAARNNNKGKQRATRPQSDEDEAGDEDDLSEEDDTDQGGEDEQEDNEEEEQEPAKKTRKRKQREEPIQEDQPRKRPGTGKSTAVSTSKETRGTKDNRSEKATRKSTRGRK